VGSFHPSRLNTQTGRLTEAMLDDVFGLVKERLGRRPIAAK
jgi:uracil-DNA glycosylase